MINDLLEDPENWGRAKEISTPQWSRVGTGMIIYNHLGQILMGKRLSPYGYGTWNNSGGKLEFGEDPQDCAIREAYEETNLKVVDVQECGYLNDVEDYGTGKRHWVTLMFAGRVFNMADLQNIEPTKHSEWKWFHLDRFPYDMWDPMRNWWHDSPHAWRLTSMLQECYGARNLGF